MQYTNIACMIMEDSDEERIRLIDLDWAASETEGRYLANINPGLVVWGLAPDVAPLGVMKRQHNIWALDYLVQKHCADKMDWKE